ncbi:DivIVA domain-containing protein [Micromonospora inyonensis]|uniref:Cell wall synthesis protein Wag31 n=1 Tax=Micromonospora inyonensis TaxID=47866 RepID=A0A1C6RC32_9ACTN|nr:DivIVA domain-containing protein [Micromonospora inyonensis]SCL14542.1 DivIVA domain-containing protein [Micromonospora inyonensis]
MSHRPVPLAPRHRRDWRTWWRRCTCGLAWPCPDRRLPVPVESAPDGPLPAADVVRAAGPARGGCRAPVGTRARACRPSPPAPVPPAHRSGVVYLARTGLRPYQIRHAVFDRRWVGFAPEQVHAYLDRVAAELDRLHREVVVTTEQADRIRDGLRQWQTRHAGCRFDHAPRR